jgi:two-component system sensor histidine kinase TctE
MTDMTRAAPSLRRTLLMWLLVPLLTLLLISSIAIYRVTLNFSRVAYDRNLDESAEDISQIIIRNAATSPRPFVLSKSAREMLLEDKYDDFYYNIRDERGALQGGDASLPAPPQNVLERSDKTAVFYDALVKNKAVRVVTLPVVLGTPNNARLIRIQVAETLHKRKTLAKEVLTLITLPQLLIIALAASIIWYAVGRSLRPLIQLEASVAARSPLELNPMEMTGVPTETRPLIGAINGLLDRVVRVLHTQSRFVTDASHQLRTPLAGLKTHIALALRQNTLGGVQYSLGQLEVGVDKLIHLANQLLSLARNEPGADRALKLVAVDLNALAQSVTGEWISVAYKRGIDLGFEGAGEPVWINGDSLRLTELLNNLLDNGLRYTPQGGIVTVRVSHPPLLEVEDNGPGIPESDREMIFERFYRLPENQADGSGLGLAIVKEIAEIHQATLAFKSGAHHQGSCFQLAFPSA